MICIRKKYDFVSGKSTRSLEWRFAWNKFISGMKNTPFFSPKISFFYYKNEQSERLDKSESQKVTNEIRGYALCQGFNVN
jgi:hypothetical protein